MGGGSDRLWRVSQLGHSGLCTLRNSSAATSDGGTWKPLFWQGGTVLGHHRPTTRAQTGRLEVKVLPPTQRVGLPHPGRFSRRWGLGLTEPKATNTPIRHAQPGALQQEVCLGPGISPSLVSKGHFQARTLWGPHTPTSGQL